MNLKTISKTDMKDIELYRVSCAHNTFLVCSLLQQNYALSKEQRVRLAKQYCTGFFGFKNDGLIFLENEPGFDFKWDFYNADGSGAEMCGNAARGVALLFQKLEQKKQAQFLTLAGSISTQILSSDLVRVTMPMLSDEKQVQLDGGAFFFVNSGVPHLVVEQKPDFELGKKLRSDPLLGSAGANVTFVQLDNPFNAVTFERGVEDFTPACGTGAVAAARWFHRRVHKKAPQNLPIQVQMPGGMLTIDFFGPEEKQVHLCGQATIDFKLIVPDLG